MGSLTLVIKPVSSACNLRCDYCYNADRSLLTRESSGTMPHDVLVATIERLLEIEQKKTVFLWHGGEPLLAGLRFFEEAIAAQREVLVRLGLQRDVRNRIQTNATLIGAVWAEWGKRERIGFGVSLDGPSDVHNRYRKTRDGRGSFELTMKGIVALEAVGVKVGFGAVVSKASLTDPAAVFRFFAEQFKQFEFSPCVECALLDPEASEFAVTPEEYASFYKATFDLWWERDDPSLKIRCFENTVVAVLGKTPELCSMAGTCKSFLCVDADGGVYPCGRFGGLRELRLGSILDRTFPEILEGRVAKGYYDVALSYPKECVLCKWFYACHNGCAYRRYRGNGLFVEKDPLCEATKEIFEHVSHRVNETQQRARSPSHEKDG